MPTKKKKQPKAILCNDKYGIYYGELTSFDVENRVAEVKNCRHVARWYGKTGGITSLASHGLCGPNASNSRIGAPCDATLTGIVNIFYVTKEASETFDRNLPHE